MSEIDLTEVLNQALEKAGPPSPDSKKIIVEVKAQPLTDAEEKNMHRAMDTSSRGTHDVIEAAKLGIVPLKTAHEAVKLTGTPQIGDDNVEEQK